MSQATGRQRRPFGLWDSAVGVDDVTDGIGLRTPTYDTDGRSLIWLERRGADAVLLCRSRGEVAPRELASGHRIRTKVFYGGGEFTVGRGCVVFVDDGSRLFVQPLDGGRARALTPAFGHPSAPTVSPDGRWIIYVHSDGRTDQPLIGGRPVPIGRYELTFHVGAYFADRGVPLSDPPFLDRIPLQFAVSDPEGHLHVPLLVTPWSYATYRGS